MLEIDCSKINEAGGQILRTSLGLSALLRKEVKITHIRSGRPNPGLQPQHLASVNTIASMCSAELEQANPNSSSLVFKPGKIIPSQLSVNIGTAGSLSLMLQQLLPVSLVEKIELRAQGGTHVSFSPSMHFMQEVLFPQLKRMGLHLDLDLLQFGFFPKGNGRIFFTSEKPKLPLKALKLSSLGKLSYIKCYSICSGLPREIAFVQANSALKSLQKKIPDNDFEFVEQVNATPTRKDTIGTALDLFAYFDSGLVLAGNALGEKGKPAEQVGQEAADNLLTQLEAQKSCDLHLADQIIPFCALAKGESELRVSKITQHCLTNIEIVKLFLPEAEMSVHGNLNEPGIIKIKGIAFTGLP